MGIRLVLQYIFLYDIYVIFVIFQVDIDQFVHLYHIGIYLLAISGLYWSCSVMADNCGNYGGWYYALGAVDPTWNG